MRIGELSRVTGMSVPTIKFYVREGLLPAGQPTAAVNQVEYDASHVRRLRLLRALIQVGGISVATARQAIAAIEDESLSLHDTFGIVLRTAAGPELTDPPPDVGEARAEVDRFLADRGWEIADASAARDQLADTLVGLRRLGQPVTTEVFTLYADAAEKLAKREVATISPDASRADAAEAALIGTVVYETALTALRRLAHAHYATRRFSGEPGVEAARRKKPKKGK